MPETYARYLDSPIGVIEIIANQNAITGLNYIDERPHTRPVSNAVADAAALQLKQYLDGTLTKFTIPLDLQGTPFQKSVWQALLNVGYGKTVSYKAIAEAVGNPNAVRAVGAANGKNPVAIIVPCHRIIGSDGSLTGYSSGIWRKEWLLRHEGCL